MMALLEFPLIFFPDALDGCHVYFIERCERHCRLLALDETLRETCSKSRHGDTTFNSFTQHTRIKFRAYACGRVRIVIENAIARVQ